MRPLIRGLESTVELEKCVEIQSLVWGLPVTDTVSARILATCLEHNALLLGAFFEDILTGFCFSLPSGWRGTPAHHSHMLAVLPGYQDQGIGFALKQAQFNSLRDTVNWITWTFDPLESRNARLNLKLGVSISTYLQDLYGEAVPCELHRGLETDRFVAEWPTKSRRRPVEKESKPFGNPKNSVLVTKWDEKGFYRPSDIDFSRHESSLLLEIPENIQKIKNLSASCALEWRSATRKGLEYYFGKGYVIRRFHTFINTEPRIRRSFYILSR